MAIQIIGLRDYFNRKQNRYTKKEVFYDRKWRASSVADLFVNIQSFVDAIPAEERYNIYYTAADCLENSKSRLFGSQSIIPIDIDGIDTDQTEEYINEVSKVVGIDRSQMGIVYTGNGLHFIIGIRNPITDEDYFDDHRVYYKGLCANINTALERSGLSGKADPSIWSVARLLRLPLTENRKKDKGIKHATLINDNIEPQDTDIIKLSGIPIVPMGAFISDRMLQQMPIADSDGVQEGCDFLKWCLDNQAKVSEPQWYAMLSILGRLPDGQELAHAYSMGHPMYNEAETNLKLEQAIESSGPRTCDNIGTLWDGCPSCSNYQQCTSPIQITSKTYIKTKETGFHDIIRDVSGVEKKRVPNYDDLMKYFEQLHPFVTMAEGNVILIWNGTHWQDFAPRRVDAFAEEHFDPKPTNRLCSEFYGKLTRNNIREPDWFKDDNKINFANGVLDLETYELSEHSIDYGFKYCLPFDYDPDAEAPRFQQYLREVTLDDDTLSSVLLEFMGYSLSNIDPSIGQKALILTGEGSNGKSVFMDLLKFMAGKGNYTTLNMGYEIAKLENRYQLDGKLFNVSEETPAKAMLESSVFKALVTGGEIQARKLYCDAYSMKNTAKLIMACNDLPPTSDMSHGMIRRLLIVPFRATFEGDNQDVDIRQTLYEEASGIFNMVLQALQRFKIERKFSDSDVISNAVAAYRMDNNSVLSWWSSNMVKDEEAKVSINDIYQSYRFDAEESGLRPENKISFGRQLKRIVPDSMKKSRIEGRVVRAVEGYKLIVQESHGF